MQEQGRKMIPNNIKHLSFCKVRTLSKKPFELKWEKIKYTAEDIKEWVIAGNNYGVMSGYQDLATLDCDCEEFVALAIANLPSTFTVQSSSENKRHFYFYIKDFPKHKEKFIFINPSFPNDPKKEGGDI